MGKAWPDLVTYLLPPIHLAAAAAAPAPSAYALRPVAPWFLLYYFIDLSHWSIQYLFVFHHFTCV